MRLVQLLLLTCAVGFASTLTNTNFANDANYVIGTPAYFDTESISLTLLPGNQVQVVIDLDYDNGQLTTQNGGINNSGGNQNLTPFYYAGVTLATGDLFFYDPSAPGYGTTSSCPGTSPSNINTSPSPSTLCVTVPTNSSLDYAVVLDAPNNSGLTTGDLYTIGSAAGDVSVETAYGVLGSSTGDTYRPDLGVLVTGPGTSAYPPGHETVCRAGDPGCVTNGAQYAITLTFTPSAGLISLLQEGQIGMEFAAADCGNAVLAGVVTVPTTTPEPGTLGMIAAGLGMLGFGLARRRRKN